MKRSYVILLFIVSIKIQSQIYVYAGLGIGTYRFHQAPLETRAWLFNNNTDVSKEMMANRSFGGPVIGGYSDIKGFLIGLEWCNRRNTFYGIRDSSGTQIKQYYNERLNTYYFGFGFGNAYKRSNSSSAKKSKNSIGLLPQFGVNRFRLFSKHSINGNSSGTITEGRDFNMSLRTLVFIDHSLNKYTKLSIMPYYEFGLLGGYIKPVFETRTSYDHELYNIANYGVNISIKYELH